MENNIIETKPIPKTKPKKEKPVVKLSQENNSLFMTVRKGPIFKKNLEFEN